MKIGIIGGGFTGLTAGYLLSKKGHRVTIFEKENYLGGLSGCYKEDYWDWELEKYFHHFFSSDKDIIDLTKELELENKIIINNPITSVFVDNHIYRFDNLKSIFLFPKLSMVEKIRMLTVTASLKINPFWKPLEKITAYDFIKKTMGNNVFDMVWKPLFDGKFGNYAKKIPAAWFWTRVNKRSFKLGYFQGGYSTLINKLKEKIIHNNGKIYLSSKVNKIEIENEIFILTSSKGKESFDKIIITTSPDIFSKLIPSLNIEKSLNKFESLGALYLVLELKDKFLNDNTYWLNINDSSFPFIAVVEHTNFIDPKHYSGNHILYVGGYYPATHPYFKMSKEEILKEFLPFLQKINPEFDFSLLTSHFSLFSDQYAQPIIPLNYSLILPLVNQPVKGLYWASLHHVYPFDRGVNYAIKMGKKIANEINKEN